MDITIHHIAASASLFYGLWFGRNGWQIGAFAFWGEISNPFISIAEILEFQGYKQKHVIPFQVIFLVMFITIRLTIGTTLLWDTQVSDSDFIFKFVPTIVTIQGYEWVWFMINKVGKIVKDVSNF